MSEKKLSPAEIRQEFDLFLTRLGISFDEAKAVLGLMGDKTLAPAADDAASKSVSLARTAQELFGVFVPLPTKRYRKSDGPEFSDAELVDRELLRAADAVINERKKREKSGKPLARTELDIAQKAARFSYHVRRRQTSTPVQGLEPAAEETTARVGGVAAVEDAAEAPPDWRTARQGDKNIVQFILREFEPELTGGTMHKGLLSRYTNLRRDFYSYQRSHDLPPELQQLPTKKQMNDRIFAARAAIGERVKPEPRPRTDEQRLYDTAAKRRSRARPGSGP